MELKKDKYVISAKVLCQVIDALFQHWSFTDGEDEGNNYEVIDAQKALEQEIKDQE